MKTLLKFVPLLLACMLLGGCWDRTELNDLALVTALAIDKAKNNQVRVTAQIFLPKNQMGSSGAAGGGGGGGGHPTATRSELGENTADALSKLQQIVPRKLFWGQCKIFVMSEAFAKSGIQEQFDFLLRHPQTRERAFMFVSKGEASESLKVFPLIERYSAEALREFAKRHVGIQVTMEQLSMMLIGDSQAAVVPLIKILPTDKTLKANQTIPYIFGTAVFKKDKMVAEIPGKVTRGVMWMRNEIREYTSTFKLTNEKGTVSLNPVKASVKLIPSIEGDQWKMTLKVKTEGSIVQNGTMLNPMKPEAFKILEKAFTNDVKKRLQLTINVVQKEVKVDILGFATAFHRKYPGKWEEKKDQWVEMFPKVEVRMDIDAQILRPGLTNATGGVPEEEVKK
ncbi:Ger(x)C family spore germination protein [Paenibacillus montanisoli]|uniref:Ger(X)C family spore germination protein n=1 Tax=Paenibacillus montanisoli TaxID=2081970 RepID=A0A328UDZ1_9BACL|nr:Ger(x)C family spore germination protein [Paenibacillus montanisoli]RAP78584.1 Ger(x)C family spore germination protein [Paenibacillus montanisoli]